jgi:hypothetical protein
MLETLTIDSFQPHVGETFDAAIDGYDDVFTLTDVRAAKRINPLIARAPFTLVFRGERADIRFEHMIVLTHPVMGTLEISISPINRLADGRHEYQAVFC